MTFTRDDRTLLGDSPAKVANALHDFGADVIGINCSGGPNQLIRILQEMRAALPDRTSSGSNPTPAGRNRLADASFIRLQPITLVIMPCPSGKPAQASSAAAAAPPRRISQPCAGALERTPIGRNKRPSHREREVAGNRKHPNSMNPRAWRKKLAKGKFVFAVEMDPPRGLSTHKLLAGASLMAEAGADVIDVADSPMARMRMSPWAVCSLIQRKVKIETVLHFPTRGRNLLRVQGDLLAAHALDVRNVFVVMGDPTAIGDYPDAMDNYDLAPSGLVKLIKQGFNAGVDHAGTDIGQPTSFFVGSALNLTAPDLERELELIRRKIEGGADFVLTQPIYEHTSA